MSEISHAGAALDRLRELIRDGKVSGWLFVSVPADESVAPCGWAADTAESSERLLARLDIVKGMLRDELSSQMMPKVDE